MNVFNFNKVMFVVFVALLLGVLSLSLKPEIANSQAIDVGDNAPNTTNAVNDALANGATPEEAAQAGVDYLNSQGYVAHVGTSPDGTTSVVCANGSQVDIPPPPPPPVIPRDVPRDVPQDGLLDSPPDVPGPSNTPTATRTPTPTKGPTPTRTPTPTKGPTPTRTPTPTPASSPTPTSLPTPTLTPTATPIPFNPDTCKCDGIEYSNLAGGQAATITSFGKVEGVDIPRSQIVDQSFFLYEGAETTATRIMSSGPIAASIVSQDGGKVRYKSVWNFTMPQLKNGLTYRIQSVINCQPKVQAYNYSQPNVLGTHTSNNSFFGGIINFFANLFGISKPTVPAPSPTPTAAPVIFRTQSEDTIVSQTSTDQLQLGTFLPVQIYQKTCTFIKFRAGFQ